MNAKLPLMIVGATVLIIMGIVALTLVFTPETAAQYRIAVDFMTAAGSGDDDTAFPLLTDEMQAYVRENCPDGSVSACVMAYTPPEWDGLNDSADPVVFRRSIPDGEDAWDVQLVATYAEGQGFAGVCIYHRMEEVAPDDWRVAAWSGFISCDAPNSGIQGLRQPDAPNRVPAVQ